MKIITLIITLILLSACSNKNTQRIDAQIRSYEKSRGNEVISYKITSEKDSTRDFHIVEYTAKLEGGKTSSGHLVFSVTGDGMYTPY